MSSTTLKEIIRSELKLQLLNLAAYCTPLSVVLMRPHRGLLLHFYRNSSSRLRLKIKTTLSQGRKMVFHSSLAPQTHPHIPSPLDTVFLALLFQLCEEYLNRNLFKLSTVYHTALVHASSNVL